MVKLVNAKVMEPSFGAQDYSHLDHEYLSGSAVKEMEALVTDCGHLTTEIARIADRMFAV